MFEHEKIDEITNQVTKHVLKAHARQAIHFTHFSLCITSLEDPTVATFFTTKQTEIEKEYTVPSGYVKIAIENEHRNSGFTH